MLRLTIRATDDSVPEIMLKLMQERLAAGEPMASERYEPMARDEISNAFGHVMVT